MLAHLRLAFAAAALAGAMAATPALAQSGANYPGYPGANYYPNQGSYSTRQGPDGTYDSLADFIGDLRGRPCDIECTREAQARWAAYYARPDHLRGRHHPVQSRY